MKRTYLYLIVSSFLVLIFFGFTEKKTKILIIGDSISLGYTPFVKKMLEDKAIVSHNKGNAQDSGYGLENIESWIQEDD
jgi:hypothetical protein